MKPFLLSICFVFLLASCSPTYYYTRISPLSEDIAQNDEGDFIIEDDSLLVAYWFNGQDAPMFINIYNKSDEPLFVDWGSSALIIDNVATAYKNSIYDIAQERVSATVESFTEIDESYIIESTYPRGADVSFIPPRSRTTFQSYALSEIDYEQIPDKLYTKSSIADKDGQLSVAKVLRFGEEDTPLRFKSYLTLYRNEAHPFKMESEFFMSDVIKSQTLTPQNAQLEFINKGDMFFTKRDHKHKGRAGNIILGTAVVGLAVVGVIWGGDQEVTYYEDDY